MVDGMTHPLPEMMITEPPVEYIEEVCGLYFRSVFLRDAGMIVWQHVHDHDHATFVGSGAVRAWVGDACLGDFEAGRAVGIKAGAKHLFQALKPNTRLACVHDVRQILQEAA